MRLNQTPLQRKSHRSLALRLLLILLSLALLGGCNPAPSQTENPTVSTTADAATTTTPDAPTSTTPQVQKKRVAITFDDGPRSYQSQTKKIVDELDQYGFTATFFVVGNRIESDGTLPYIVEHGSEIGIHGYTHRTDRYFDTCSDADYEYEISQTAAAIQKQVPGYDINLMRPVGGRISSERERSSPYSIILWNVDSEDWKNTYYSGISDEAANAKVNTIVENVMSTVSDGSIILMHDIYESTYDATKIILKRLYDEGYEVVSVSELLGDSLIPGQRYREK